MPQIRIPPVLRSEAGGNRNVDVAATTVGEALQSLVASYPALETRVLEGSTVPTFLNVFVDGQDVRLLAGLDTPVETTSTILLLPAVAGGGPASRPTPAPAQSGSPKAYSLLFGVPKPKLL